MLLEKIVKALELSVVNQLIVAIVCRVGSIISIRIRNLMDERESIEIQ